MKHLTKKNNESPIVDSYGSWIYTKEQIKRMDTSKLARLLKKHFRWSQGKGEYNDKGVLSPDKHKPMPFSPSTFRYLVMEVLYRLTH